MLYIINFSCPVISMVQSQTLIKSTFNTFKSVFKQLLRQRERKIINSFEWCECKSFCIVRCMKSREMEGDVDQFVYAFICGVVAVRRYDRPLHTFEKCNDIPAFSSLNADFLHIQIPQTARRRFLSIEPLIIFTYVYTH